MKIPLESHRLAQEAEAVRLQAEYHQAELKAARDALLVSERLIPELDAKLSRSVADELANRLRVERERVAILKDSIEAQVRVQEAQIRKLEAVAALKQDQVAALQVRARATGVLQEAAVQIGQRVAAGTVLAKVAQPERLKAELKVPETQAKDVQIGQRVMVDTRNGTIPGTVARVHPAVREGTVTVDVRLEGALPPGARPDLSVEGIIEIENVRNILYVERPVFAQAGSSLSLFRLEPDGKHASPVKLRLGRPSVTIIEVVAVMELLRDLHRAGSTICMVTHDPRYASYAGRTVHLFDGRILDEADQ